MKLFGIAALAVATLAVTQPCTATVTPETAAVMPKCATGDQIVMVDPKNKTYSVYAPSSTAQSRREKSDSEAKFNADSLNAGIKPMCKSQADAMGAKLTPSPASPMPSASQTP